MATKKREIYARVATQLRTHDRATMAEEICPGAMGLYLFLLIQARGESTNGDVNPAAAHASWSAPTAYRKKQAAALMEVGLIELRDARYHVIKYDEHNDTPEDIARAREGARSRKQTQRGHADVTRDMPVTAPVGHAEVPYSISISPSGSGSSLGRDPDPNRSPTQPDWWGGAVGAAEEAVGPIDSVGARWLEYDASRERKGWARNHRDAVGWLTAVMRSEREKKVQQGLRPKSDAEITKQGFDPDAPWIRLGDTGS